MDFESERNFQPIEPIEPFERIEPLKKNPPIFHI